MSNSENIALVDRLRREPTETEWLEFKADRYEPKVIGEYLSALANGACVAGKTRGYLVFGVDDATHAVVGTSFNPYAAKGKGNQDLLLWLTLGLDPRIGIEAHLVDHPGGRVVLFEIGAPRGCPVKFYGTAYIRVGTSKTELAKHPEKERAIWSRGLDWSAQICERATLADLDPEAIRKARQQFKIKHPRSAELVDDWDEMTFLNKAKVTLHGNITNTALILLGKPESAGLLSPSVAKISWILKDAENRELDYEHFFPPFILQVDQVLARIRNLTLRMLPSGTLFPQEITQYDPWVIREALHNCIAHQDYTLGCRTSVVETPTSVLLRNCGAFLPGSVEDVIERDAPSELYRNPFLADAMVNLNMIDTQGGGIKRMFETQIKRFFPLPDYDLSEIERVAVTIRGEILDEQYTQLLMDRTHLGLPAIMLLDKVQKHIPISPEDHRFLKRANLVEGRYPHLIIAGRIAKAIGQPDRHILERGFENQYYRDLILKLVQDHGPVSRENIDHLLMGKLPDVLTVPEKKEKIHNLLSGLSTRGLIVNKGSRSKPQWILGGKDTN
ncbi:putative DNA-binding domain protein [anaerobic digester metagenome]